MASLLPATARAQAVQAVAAPRAAAKAQPAAAARLGGPISQKQWLRNALAQRRGIAQRRGAASRLSSARVVARGGGEALVIGSSGQTAARVIVQLLRAGFKVTAGVDTDPEEAADVVKFAKKTDILAASEAANLKLVEFNPLDADEIGSVLRKGMRVVLVVGDQAGNRRPDLRVYDSVVDALLENTSKIGQLVVVTPQGGGGTQLFGRGGGGGARLSPLEAKVAESGADYLIVRAAPSDRVTDRYGEQANVVVAPAGRLPSGLQASRAQVAAVVAQAMAQARGSAVIEVAASPAAPAANLASAVAQALAGGAQEEEEEEAPAPAPTPAKTVFGFGTRKISKPAPAAVEQEEEEEEAPAAPAKKTIFGFGTRKISKPAAVVEEEEEEEEEEVAAPKARKPLFGGFGTRKISKPAPVVEEEEEEEEPAPAPAPKKKAAGGFFTLSSKKQPAAKQAEEAEEEEEAAPAPKKAFAFSSSRRQPAPEAAEAAAPAPAPAPEQPKRIIRGRKPLAAPVEEKPRPAPAQPAPAAQENGAPKKSGGFLGFLGISSETVYADEQ
ncbi:hypothetical protein ABPG77_011482 [Micractinium sp. CCAP 211/92]